MQSEYRNTPIVSEFADDPDLVEIIDMYVSVLPERVASMREAFEKSDIQQLRQLAHQLKGSGGSHGFAMLSDTAAELENACKAEALDKIRAELGELAVLISRVTARAL